MGDVQEERLGIRPPPLPTDVRVAALGANTPRLSSVLRGLSPTARTGHLELLGLRVQVEVTFQRAAHGVLRAALTIRPQGNALHGFPFTGA